MMRHLTQRKMRKMRKRENEKNEKSQNEKIENLRRGWAYIGRARGKNRTRDELGVGSFGGWLLALAASAARELTSLRA